MLTFKKIWDFLRIKTVTFRHRIKNSVISLRRYSLKDLPYLYSLFNRENPPDSDLTQNRPFGSFFSFCKWIFASFQVLYLIEVLENGERRIVGFIGLYKMIIKNSVWLSVAVFKPDDRGRGFGKKAILLLLDYLRLNGIIERVCVEILQNNLTSLSLFKDLGFEIYGQEEDRFFLEKYLPENKVKL